MKTNHFLIIAIGFICLLTSCEPHHLLGVGAPSSTSCEGENIHLGNLAFESATNDFAVFNSSKESLVFSNENGEELTWYIESRSEENVQLKIETICGSTNGFPGNSVYSYYNNIYAEAVYRDDNEFNNEMNLSRTTKVVEEYLPEKYLYDVISIGGRFGETYFKTIKIITSVRGSEETFPEDFLEETNSYNFNETIELGGIIYQNVYSSDQAPAITSDVEFGVIYMTKESGVIGLLDKEEVFWKLEDN